MPNLFHDSAPFRSRPTVISVGRDEWNGLCRWQAKQPGGYTKARLDDPPAVYADPTVECVDDAAHLSVQGEDLDGEPPPPSEE